MAPHLSGRVLAGWHVRNPNLRWPVTLPDSIREQPVVSVARRAKYLLINLPAGALIVHLGMSGSLRIADPNAAPGKHDHVDLLFTPDTVLRYNDPRRFGSIHWQRNPVMEHPLLRALGPEPLGLEFDGAYLKRQARGRRVGVKNFIMDAHVVVGVGNIYANEALFLSGLRPTARAGRVTRAGYERLAIAIRRVLGNAIAMGGTTLRDFVNSDGNPGYFQQSLYVYGRAGQPCRLCATPLKGIRTGQRASVFCPTCQAAGNFGGRDV